MWIHDNIYVANTDKGTVILNITIPQYHVKSHEISKDNNMEDLYEFQIKQDEPFELSALQSSPSILDGLVHTLEKFLGMDSNGSNVLDKVSNSCNCYNHFVPGLTVYGLYKVVYFALNVKCWTVNNGQSIVYILCTLFFSYIRNLYFFV